MRLIDRDGLKHQIIETYEYEFPTASGAFDEFVTKIIPNIINNAPTIDVEPVVRGEWVPNKRYDGCMVCDQCGFGIEINTRVLMECNRRSDEREFSICAGDVELAYCPNCGAHMDGKDGE